MALALAAALVGLGVLVPGTSEAAASCAVSMERAETLAADGIVTYVETVREMRSALGAALRARDGECRDRSARALTRLFLQGGDNWAAIRLVSQYKSGNARVRRDPELSNLLGLAYYYEEMYDEASRQFQIALEADPKLVVPVFNLQSINARLIRLNTARAYQRAREYDKALAEYLDLLRVSQNFVTGHYRLGLLYLEMGRLDEARRSFVRAVRINPRHHQVHHIYKVLGDVFAAEQERFQAAEAYMKALERKPDYREARIALEQFKAQ